MPKGQQDQRQQNNQNPDQVQTQHDDQNVSQDQAQLVNQNNHIARPNISELPTLDQQIKSHTQSQENLFYTLSYRLDTIDEFLKNMQKTQNEMISSIRSIKESLRINQDNEWSKPEKFIYQHLTELKASQISLFFQKFLDQNNNLGISLTPDEMRDHKLLLHKIDVYWDIIEPHLLAKYRTIIDEILHPHQ